MPFPLLRDYQLNLSFHLRCTKLMSSRMEAISARSRFIFPLLEAALWLLVWSSTLMASKQSIIQSEILCKSDKGWRKKNRWLRRPPRVMVLVEIRPWMELKENQVRMARELSWVPKIVLMPEVKMTLTSWVQEEEISLYMKEVCIADLIQMIIPLDSGSLEIIESSKIWN